MFDPPELYHLIQSVSPPSSVAKGLLVAYVVYVTDALCWLTVSKLSSSVYHLYLLSIIQFRLGIVVAYKSVKMYICVVGKYIKNTQILLFVGLLSDS